jgi:hypothetical protein
LTNAVSFGNRVGVENWQTDGRDSLLMLNTLVVYGEECLLMQGKRFKLADGQLELVEKLRALLCDELCSAGRWAFGC